MTTDATLRNSLLMTTMSVWREPGAEESIEAEEGAAFDPPAGGVGDIESLSLLSAAGGAETEGASASGQSLLFDDIEDVLGFLRKAMSQMAHENRRFRNSAAQEALESGLRAADELGLQAAETKKAAEEQAEGMTVGGMIKLIAIVVAIVVIARVPGTGGAVAAGLIAGFGAALAEVQQGGQTEAAARHTKAASDHEQVRSELQAFGEKLRHEKDQRGQDYSLVLQLLEDAQELAKELRTLAKQNGF